jgi:hypothetical protein
VDSLAKNQPKDRMGRIKSWGSFTLAALSIALVLALLDPRGEPVFGFFAYASLMVIISIFMKYAWQIVTDIERPRWLLAVFLLAFFLRLGLGVGLTLSLPTFGYEENISHSAGYIYRDAYNRDVDAWNLGRSDRSLLTAWNDPELSDQYSGLLFLSASIYRVLSPEIRRPILVILVTAAVGAIAVLFSWSFARRAFGRSAALFAAGIVAIYPEAVLLGSSQMREPFLILSTALLLDGYSRMRIADYRIGWLEIVFASVLALIISPPFSLVILGGLAVMWLWEGKVDLRGNRLVLLILALLLSVGGVLTIRGWSGIGGRPGGNNIFELVNWWISGGARYQLHLLQESSGWVQKMFALVPEWGQIPMATFYGVVQPFLPAALMDSSSAPLIRVLVSWRALGWFLALPFLIYAPILALREKGKRGLITFLALAVWLGILIVSYRDAGGMWDNPRWRAIFISAQATVIGWTWITSIRRAKPWVLRFGVVVGFSTLAFLQWEAGRYYGFPRLNLWETLALIGGFSTIFLVGSVIYDRRKQRNVLSQSP